MTETQIIIPSYTLVSFIKHFLQESFFILITIVLRLILPPLRLILKKSRGTPEEIEFKLISWTNYLFPYTKAVEQKHNAGKKDCRTYRDQYEVEGIEVLFKQTEPETIFTGKQVLDFGCGFGGKSKSFLKWQPVSVTGVDLSERSIKYAQELQEKHLSFRCTSVLDLSAGETFNTIVSFTVFEHITKSELPSILDKLYSLLSVGGDFLIVFNHYNSKWGSHLKEYIYHPWPQLLFSENILYKYWTTRRQSDGSMGEDSYFPSDYEHGIENPNQDCFMNLNKVSIKEFEKIISNTSFNYVSRYDYSRSCIYNLAPTWLQDMLRGSCVYHLKKSG